MNTACALLVIGVFLALPAHAAERVSTPAATLSLKQAVAGALANNPRLQDVAQQRSARVADAIEATTFENPTLQADWTEKGSPANTGNLDVEIEQPLKFSQLTGSRETYAQALRDFANQDSRLETLRTIGDVRSLYVQLWLLRRQKELYESSASDAERITGLVNKASGAGQVAPSAASLFRGDAARLRAEIIALAGQLSEGEAQLGRATGLRVSGMRLSAPSLAAIPASAETLQRFAESRSPLRNVLKAEARAARERLTVAEEDSGFTFAPRLIYGREDDGAQQSVGVGLALTIPLWDQGDAEQTRARGDLRAAENKLTAIETRGGNERIALMHRSALQQQQRADAYARDVLPSFRQAYERARRAFIEGQMPPLELWQVRERLYQAEEAALKAEAEAFRARTELEFEVGGLLEEVGS